MENSAAHIFSRLTPVFLKIKGSTFTERQSRATHWLHCILLARFTSSLSSAFPMGIRLQDVFQNKLLLCHLHATAAELS